MAVLFRLTRRRSPKTDAAAPPRTRRGRMPVVILGGGRRRRGRFLMGFLRRIRQRCLAMQWRRAVKRLREYYVRLLRDLSEGAASMEAVQSRIMMESYFAAPFMPVSTVPSSTAHYCIW